MIDSLFIVKFDIAIKLEFSNAKNHNFVNLQGDLPQFSALCLTHLPIFAIHPPAMLSDYLPVLFQMIIAIGFAAVVLSLSVVFGKSARTNVTKDSAYECGMLPVGDGAPRFSVKFYIVAMLFVIFDIEVVFMYPWAVQFRDMVQVSTVPLLSIAGFAGILALAYVYALKKGALNWKS